MSAPDKTSQKGVNAQGWRQDTQSRGRDRGEGAVNRNRDGAVPLTPDPAKPLGELAAKPKNNAWNSNKPAKPTQSWYSVCAKKLWDGEGDALAVFLAELLKECKSTDNDIAIVTNDSIKKMFSKKSKYNAGGLPQLVEEVLEQQNADFHWGAIIIHIWNVLNDPSQQFVMEEDDIVMQALCIIFEAKIIFEKNGTPLQCADTRRPRRAPTAFSVPWG